MTKNQYDEFFIKIIDEIKETRDNGQKEYAHTENNVFANFERVADGLNISKEQALMVYLMKHMDGINAWIKGHKSQRENVTGRIKDAIVYLCLLWGMAEKSNKDIDSFLDEHGFTPSKRPNNTVFNPETGEVSYQSHGEEAI